MGMQLNTGGRYSFRRASAPCLFKTEHFHREGPGIFSNVSNFDSGLRPNDPKRTLASASCCSSEAVFSPYQSTRLSRYDAVSSAGANMSNCVGSGGFPLCMIAQHGIQGGDHLAHDS